MSHWRTTAADGVSLSVLSPKCEHRWSFPFGGNLCVYLLPSLVSIGKRAYYAPTAETRNCFYTAIRCARFTHALHRRCPPSAVQTGRKVENSQVVLRPLRPPSSILGALLLPNNSSLSKCIRLSLACSSPFACLFQMPPSRENPDCDGCRG